MKLSDSAGLLKILIGTYAGRNSTVKTYGFQFMYHLQINNGKEFTLTTNSHTEYAGFVIAGKININDTNYSEGELIVFNNEGDEIQLRNNTNEQVTIILFGGEPYKETIVAQGPFVMNTSQEITEAYNDAKANRYGKINYRLQAVNQ